MALPAFPGGAEDWRPVKRATEPALRVPSGQQAVASWRLDWGEGWAPGCHRPGGHEANTDYADYCTPAVPWLKPVRQPIRLAVAPGGYPGHCSLGLHHLMAVEILEADGDRLYRRVVAGLYEFTGEHSAQHVLRWKDITDGLEDALNQLARVAYTVQGIVLKHV